MRESLTEIDANIVFVEGFDDALLGFVERFGCPTVAVYDRSKCIQSLITEGMNIDEAEEYFEFNVIGAYVGEYTPYFITFFTQIG